ncbi:TonB-dependent receptor domain-containing protein [Mucilaginibacter sp.]|uniref:TonB-dependent receptor n=1 Tax=Mucilaginibacter sp. TaxID=1882438 RepID=UPI002849C7B7|nr:TonB-dependent receptor [Mucilaginibacter sp.]MDR3693468.1 TonB-dependent receptor [Mucilaginibacter sp.]
MVKIYTSLFFIFAIATGVAGQTQKDTSRNLQAVTIKAYLTEQPVLTVPASVSVISQQQLNVQPDNSFISVLNSQPGVRAEERSPGSYRLSIRGSLLRSPFGVRDVKIYYDDIPLTDAGGNTYLNAIDFNSIHNMEVLKGPDGSLFGANSGGVVLLSPVNHHADGNYISAGLNGGSYGLLHENTALQNKSGNYQLNLNQAYEGYGGYRQHSYMQRHYIQVVNSWTYNKNDQFRLLGFYSDLDYETPGGLTLTQFEADPQEARVPTKVTPGAIQQKAGIYQKVLFGGAVNEYHFNEHLRNVLSVFGTYVDFTNPFITNYGQRYEGTYGFRTYFEYTGDERKNYNWKTNFGVEWQQTNSDINNYGNRNGARDTAQTLDKINTNQHFFFGRYVADIAKRFRLETALSLNFYDYKFLNVFPNAETAYTDRNFKPQLMPRVALAYQITNDFVWRASVSRGYSTPTTAEIRPTDHAINPNLGAEDGWNYETGFRLRNTDESMFLDASVFYYRINNAIVPRFNADETTYYINAGGTNQPGLEVYFTDWIIRQNNSDFVRGLQFNESVTLDHFKFSSDYHDATSSYAGNQLTGVPEQVVITSLQIKLPQYLYLYIEHNYTARIPLNDGNTVYAPHYNLLAAKAGWQHQFNRKSRFELYAGAENLLNQKYSLGDDLNALGSRYYNAAPPRNYYLGFNVMF